MELILTNSGSYPRIGESPEEQILRRAIAAWEKGEKSSEDLRAAEDTVTKMVISEQIKAGLDLVTDGQIRWYDPISHLASRLEGVSIDGLLRFFDTNFYFRQPVVEGRINRVKPIIVEEFLFAKSFSSKPVKPVVTGPYTLARLSIVSSHEYKTFGKLSEGFAHEIREEIKGLSQAGAEIIQIDEPAILKHPNDYEFFKEAMLIMNSAKGSSKLALYTYFGDSSLLYDRFQTLPVDILGIDFTYSRGLIDIISDTGSKKPLGLGLIDGRNTRIESKKEIMRVLERILPRIESGFSYLNPSCGLEYLPRDRAFQKLRNMSEIKREFSQGAYR
jgi:5-methyltetrahydropteroyltriglutamate--homocysteine methyltransferase